MQSQTRHIAAYCGGAVLLLGWMVPAAAGEVTDISGHVTVSITQFFETVPIQSDVNTEIVPLTTPVLPAVARAQLDRLLAEDVVSAGAEAVALLDRPNLTGIGTPNDVGMDLGAFSDDGFTQWIVEGVVREKRRIRLSPREVGGDVAPGATLHVRSQLVLSGVMIITSPVPGADLTGVEVSLDFSVTQQRLGEEPVTLLEGGTALTGGPDGAINVEEATGALADNPPPVVDFTGQLETLPVARAVVFTGLVFPYEYEVVLGEPFELDLLVSSELVTMPGMTGAAAVFGAPQESLGSILARVKHDDRGHQLAAMISEHVDTTGRAYQADGSASGPLSAIFPLCGVMGMEGAAAMVMSCCWTWRRRQRHVTRQLGK